MKMQSQKKFRFTVSWKLAFFLSTSMAIAMMAIEILSVTGVDNAASQVIISLAVVVVVEILFMIILRQVIVKPLKSISETWEALAQGKGDKTFKIESSDEIGDVAHPCQLVLIRMQEVRELSERIAVGDLTVEVKPVSEQDTLLVAFAQMVENQRNLPLLIHLLSKIGVTRSMVFVTTKRVAEYVERKLRANGIEAAAMSADVPQARRLRMLRDFHEGKLAVLVATDVAARGLHIPDVSHVFNYDLPQYPEDYVHRIGRTARAGAFGDAISLGCEEYVVTLPDIESFIGRKLPVEQFDPHELPDVASASNVPRHQDTQSWREREERRSGLGGHGGRGGHGERPRQASRRGGPPPQREAPAAGRVPVAPPPAPPAEAPTAGQEAPAAKRRRRRTFQEAKRHHVNLGNGSCLSPQRIYLTSN